jgi:Ankyrin repeats (3 copies)
MNNSKPFLLYQIFILILCCVSINIFPMEMTMETLMATTWEQQQYINTPTTSNENSIQNYINYIKNIHPTNNHNNHNNHTRKISSRPAITNTVYFPKKYLVHVHQQQTTYIKQKKEVAEQLRKKNEEQLRMAVLNDKKEELCTLINLGVNVNAQCPQEHNTALHIAAQKGHVEIGTTLINQSTASINSRNKNGYTPLHCAIFSLKTHKNNEQLIQFIELLLNNGALITIKDKDGKRPDNAIAVETAETPPNEMDIQQHKALIKQYIDNDDDNRFKDLIPMVQSTKEQRALVNKAHSLLLETRLEHYSLKISL